jgi:OOP family OmpA-OmpF porin
MVDRMRRPALALGLLAVVGRASAADSGFYIGAHGGWVRFPDHVTLGSTALTDPTGEPSSFSWDLFAGYRFNRYVSLELGYIDLGRYSDELSDPETGSFGTRSFAAKGETLAAVGTLPLGRWDLFAKAGVLHANTHLDFGGTVGGAPANYNIRAADTHPLVGVGIGYELTDHLHLELAGTAYLHVGSGALPQGHYEGPNLNVLSLGFSYRF